MIAAGTLSDLNTRRAAAPVKACRTCGAGLHQPRATYCRPCAADAYDASHRRGYEKRKRLALAPDSTP